MVDKTHRETSNSFHLYWKVLLAIKSFIRKNGDPPGLVHFPVDFSGDNLNFDEEVKGEFSTVAIFIDKKSVKKEIKASCSFLIEDYTRVSILKNEVLPEDEAHFLTLYLPYCFLDIMARKEQRAISISHFAQSLDGKIATSTGNSRWISSEENLIHAHRMRALCDGILVGVNTLIRDEPRLTVRKVEGDNPVKIIVGNTPASFESVKKSNDKVLYLTSGNGSIDKDIEVIRHKGKGKGKGHIPPVEILKKIYKDSGIHSVYIEGGAYTTSTFLQHGALDEVQLFLSPVLFGSGITNFTLPMINEVEESWHFDPYSFYTMGNGILFKGKPKLEER